jgi:hypothetical protein
MAGRVESAVLRPSATDDKSPERSSSCLNGWKEMASYFGRSVRTVQRWEALEGMPVRRHRHSLGESIYANCDELEGWRMTRAQIVRGRTKPRTPHDQWSVDPRNRDIVIRAFLNALLSLDPTTDQAAPCFDTRPQAHRQPLDRDTGLLDEG